MYRVPRHLIQTWILYFQDIFLNRYLVNFESFFANPLKYLNQKIFWPYVSNMVGKLLMWELILCDLEDIFSDIWKAINLRDTRDSNKGHISNCILTQSYAKHQYSHDHNLSFVVTIHIQVTFALRYFYWKSCCSLKYTENPC